MAKIYKDAYHIRIEGAHTKLIKRTPARKNPILLLMKIVVKLSIYREDCRTNIDFIGSVHWPYNEKKETNYGIVEG